MNGIYKEELTGKFYKKVEDGTGRYRGMFKWQPVKKFGCFYIKDRASRVIWLDDYGFELVRYSFSIKRCVFDLPAKIHLMHSRNYYRTMSGDWRDSHMVNYIPKELFYRLSLEELRKEL